jgi:hypothetical protein
LLGLSWVYEVPLVNWLSISWIWPLLAPAAPPAVAAVGSVYEGIDAMLASKLSFPAPNPYKPAKGLLVKLVKFPNPANKSFVLDYAWLVLLY